ncbi:MAG TPA: efflux RND transporter periplasmic adaptor subunit [bacterium]|nr:efflux RND transporter periplasmic adaptor subunit [bacterium]
MAKKAKKRFYQKWWFRILAFAVVCLTAFVVYSALQEPKVIVQSGKVAKGELTQVVSASGRVNPAVEVEISANIAGEITKINTREGERVEKGQVLVTLDNQRYAASYDQSRSMLEVAKTELARAKAQHDLAASSFERSQQLFKQKLISQEALEISETELKVAQAALKAAQDNIRNANAGLQISGNELSKTTIRSPIDGVVTSLKKEEGEIAIGSTFTRDVIMIVSDPNHFVATVDVDEADIVDIEIGDDATVELDAFPDAVFQAKVIEIAGSATVSEMGLQEETVSFQVKVLLEGDTALIRPGMSATADIVTEKKPDVLHVPIQCITMRDPEQLAKEADKNKKAENASPTPAASEQATPAATEEAADKSEPAEAPGSIKRMKELLFAIKDNRAVPVWIVTGISSETDIEVEGEQVVDGMEIVCGSFKTLNRELKPNDLLEIEPEGKAEQPEE